MLDNGNREIFKNTYNFQETDAVFFAERFKNRHAQHNYKDAHNILREQCYYNFYQEIQYLKRIDRNYYGDSYEVMDHFGKFYSSDHDCYIMTAQPYWFDKNTEKIQHTLEYYKLSYVVMKGLTWHSPHHDCTLYCIGSYENLLKIFGKVDFKGETK